MNRRRTRQPPRFHANPWVVISTHNPDDELREGDSRRYATLLGAANAFAHCPKPYKTILRDDGRVARELDGREERMLEAVCSKLGLDIEEVE